VNRNRTDWILVFIAFVAAVIMTMAIFSTSGCVKAEHNPCREAVPDTDACQGELWAGAVTDKVTVCICTKDGNK
jgi:hypothetical protein